MTQYNYLEVAVLKQEGSNVSTEYIYSSEGADTTWTATAGEPGAILNLFLNAREAFVQWTTRAGNFFGLVFKNAFSNQDGYFMIAVKVQSGYGLTGRQLVRCLTGLRKRLVEERQTNDRAVDETMASAGVPQAGRSYDSWRIAPTFVSRDGALPCYRTYVSMLELENFLTFPRQQEYENYSRVIYVAATTSLKPGVEIHHVITPIKNIYTIVCPEGVECSRPAASAGDRVMLSFAKPGFATIREAVIVGRPSAFVIYDGATMNVRSAADCRLTFVKRIPLHVRSAKGGVVTGFTVSVNGRPVNTMEPYLEVTEAELEGSGPIVIQVTSNNFEVLKIERSAAELSATPSLDLELKPIEQGITLRLDFGEGRVFEQQISIERNTPEYSQLHSGQFHGFRAHRLTLAGCGEVYNVDVRSAVRPTAPNFANYAATRPAEVRPPHIEREVPAVTPEPQPEAEPENRRRRRRQSSSRRVSPGLWIGIVAVIAVLAIAAYLFRTVWEGSGNEFDPAIPATVAESVEAAGNTPSATDGVTPEAAPEAAAESQAARAAAVAMSADDAYFNRSSVWVRDSLTTDLGRSLYDAIVEGRIKDMVSHPYFATKGRATNADAVKLADMLWSAYTSSTERSNQKCMEKYQGKPIELHNLFEEAARYRSPNPNPDPRPVIE